MTTTPVATADAAPRLRLGLPSGSLQEPTLDLLAKAGFQISGASRSYKPAIDDPDILIRMLRAQEMGRYVEQGFLDAGITGKDWIAEYESQVEVICDLPYSRASSAPTRWVLVVPEDSPIQTPRDLDGGRVATEATGLVGRYFKGLGVNVHVEYSWGATEVKVPDLVDAIVDITETGASLHANKLRIVDTLLVSYPQLVMNRAAHADPWKRDKAAHIAMLIQGALNARAKVGLKMNLRKDNLDSLLTRLPALRRPTLSPLWQSDWIAVEVVLDEKDVRVLIPQLKALGAEGIIEYPLNKVIY